jgi:hypothetical protein
MAAVGQVILLQPLELLVALILAVVVVVALLSLQLQAATAAPVSSS